MGKQIKFTATLVVTPEGEAATDAEAARAYAEGEMDHVADLLYDSGDTVYRYEVLDAAAANATADPSSKTPAELVEALESLLQDLKDRLAEA